MPSAPRNLRRNLQVCLPSKKVWRVFFWAGVFLSAEWGLVYVGANWVAGLHHYRVPLSTSFDTAIPFVPAAVVFYLSLFPILWAAPFFLRSTRELRALAWSLAAAILIAGVGFVVLPARSVEVHFAETGRFRPLLEFADWINLDYNCFPSLHVAMAVICAARYSRANSAATGIAVWLWAGLIALSTLLMRQHFLGDVVAGGVLGLMVSITRPLNR